MVDSVRMNVLTTEQAVGTSRISIPLLASAKPAQVIDAANAAMQTHFHNQLFTGQQTDSSSYHFHYFRLPEY